MTNIKLLEEAMSMLGVVEGTWAVQNLRDQIPAIIEHLVHESTGKHKGRWVEESIRLLRPRCREESILYGKEMLRVYAQVMNVYDHIRKNARHETYNMKRFRDFVGFYARYLNLLGRDSCGEEAKNKTQPKHF